MGRLERYGFAIGSGFFCKLSGFFGEKTVDNSIWRAESVIKNTNPV
jgi:hypothetical protein